MNLNHNNTTFVIVTYKSELIIHEYDDENCPACGKELLEMLILKKI